ncbi:TonB-dependent receptor [Adhaeribacter sp. BT258]|uniref:TonB-dependent receptor n=1 Tax=Adhaeribacter terrigena TaxID=2793070 RepID=A0ABS1C630_9BACT|nr:TonB-dependent receptor [Adhaeribacter terrigena]MBK0404833.1 TonB-dependent receptor [Adhaeribacter terrigena]
MNQLQLRWLLCLLLSGLTLGNQGFAQSGNRFTLNGYVKDESSGEALIGATVYDRRSGKGTSTNQFGFYSLTLPADSVALLFSYVGYHPKQQHFHLKANLTLNTTLKQSQELSEVEITATKDPRIEETTQMSAVEVPIELVKKMPALFGEVDVLKVIQLMPGVQSGGEASTGLYVRGGSPDQNLILLDGVPLYYVSHLGGFFSVFNADAISNVTLIKGGYPARYGGRLSSVLDIRMREGNMKKIKGYGSLGLISAKLALEGPIIKDKTSFMVSGRRSYIDLFMRPISKAATDGAVSFGYHFYDFNAKINHILSPNDRLYLSFYGGDDKSIATMEDDYTSDNNEFETTGKSRLMWGNLLTSLRWNHLFNEKLFSNTTVNFTRYRFLVDFEQKNSSNQNGETKKEEAYFGYNSGITDFSARTDFDFYPDPQHSIKFGAQTIYHTFRPGVTAIRANFGSDQKTDTTFGSSNIKAWESSVYAEDDWEINPKLKVNGGLHFSNFLVNSKSYFSAQPRLSARYLLPDRYSLKASYATMQQFVHLLTNSDAGLPTDLWVPVTDRVKPQFSQQVALGLAKSLTLKEEEYEVSVEGYYRTMRGLIEYKEGSNFFGSTSDWQDNVETGGKGWSYGGEFLFQKKTGRLNGWIGYTLAWSERQFPGTNINLGNKYPFRYDRRHDIGAALTYQLSEDVSLSGSWVYGTGNAITLAVGRYPSMNNNSTSYGGGYFGQQIEIYDGRNGFRMRSYHRMDVGINFTKEKSWGTRTWNVSVFNAYNRKNPFYYYYGYDQRGNRRLKQVSLFPIIPAITYNFTF